MTLSPRIRGFLPTAMLLALFLLAVTLTRSAPVEAATPADPEPATCVDWAQAGKWALTRCEDEDGTVCISSDSGMLACRWEY